MASAGEPVNHFRPTHPLRAPPGIEITVALECDAMLFDPHVTHLHFFDEFVHRHSSGALERIQNFQSLSAANLGKQSLIHLTGR